MLEVVEEIPESTNPSARNKVATGKKVSGRSCPLLTKRAITASDFEWNHYSVAFSCVGTNSLNKLHRNSEAQ